MDDERKPTGDERGAEPTTDMAETIAQDDAGTPAEAGDGDALTDRHGEPAINKGRHNRLMAEKDARIAELERQIREERSMRELERAGCIDTKSAMYRLEEFDGDVGALKSECPHLFGRRQTGTTGARFGGHSGPSLDEKISRAFRTS